MAREARAGVGIVFDPKRQWREFHSECDRCHKVLGGEFLRGHVTCPFGKAYLLDAWGMCDDCMLLTRVSYRLMPNMTIVGRSPKDGAWATWGRGRRGWWARLRHWLRA